MHADEPLRRIQVTYEDGFTDEIRVREPNLTRAFRIAQEDDTYADAHGEVVDWRFLGYVPKDEK